MKHLGAIKKPETIALEKANLIGLMQNCTLKEISDMYRVSVQTVHGVLTNQLTKRNIGKYEGGVEYSQSLITKSLGAWKNSKERLAFNNDKDFIINTIEKEIKLINQNK